MDEERGKIYNRKRAAQIRDFSGVRYGNITGTDFDFVMDYHDRAWVYGEFKYLDTPLPDGQRWALERQCDDIAKVKPVIGIVASHGCAPEEDIGIATALVTQYRWHNKWHYSNGTITFKQLCDRFINWVEMEDPDNA